MAPAVPVRKTFAAAMALVASAPLLSGCFEEPSAHDAVREFLVGWQSGDYQAAARRTDGDPKVVARALEDVRLQLDAASIRFRVTGMKRVGDETQAGFRTEVDLGENNPLWSYDGKLPLRLVGGEWKVHWSPSVLHPQLKDGQRLAVEATSEPRKPIVDYLGDPLQRDADLFVAGVTPGTLKDPERLCEELSEVTGFAQDRLLGRILSAPPSEFVPLVTFGRKKYAELRSKLDEIVQRNTGLVINSEEQPVAPDAPIQIVGRVDAVTPESELQLGGPQRAGDSIGLSGLQRAYQDQLTGSTDTKVIAIDLKTQKVTQLARWQGRTNTSVETTLDARIQQAAEAATNVAYPAALVAVKADTGEVRAVATEELNEETDALAGSFPAGSAFSIVAADALLKSGVSVDQKLPCPPQRTVGGAKFQQAGAATGGAITLKAGIAGGCVTALAALGRRVDAASLDESATSFGIGGRWQLPLKSFAGEMPELTSNAMRARAIVGQNVKVSPLSMALVAGAVASGTWHPPLLVTKPASPDPTADVVPAPPPEPIKLDAKRVRTLKSLMRAGVTSGTAASANASGDPVYGIISAPVDNYSWFIGWQGDVAVAVLARGGDPGNIASQFFYNMHSVL